MRTPSPSLAPSSMMAVAWTCGRSPIRLGRERAGFGAVGQHGADLGFGHHLAVDAGFAEEAPDAAARPDLADVKMQRIARQHRLAELGLVDAHEIDEVGAVILT